MGRLGANALLCGLSVVLALVVGEVMVRYLAPQKMYRFPQGLFEPHPTLQYRMTPHFSGVSKTIEFRNQVDTNALGLRESRELGDKVPGTVRILVLGDSFTMGVGVEEHESYVRELERRLNKTRLEASVHYEVINAGVPGYNTLQALTYLREFGLALQPDLIILGFYIGNDIADNYNPPLIAVRDGYLRPLPVTQGFLPSGIRLYLARHSHLYQFLWPYKRLLFDPATQHRQQEAWRRRMAIYVTPPEPEVEVVWAATRRELKGLAEVARQSGIPVAVLVIPEPFQVNPVTWAETLQSRVEHQVTYRPDQPNQRLVQLCQELDLPVLDLLPQFAQAGGDDSEPLYIELDGHWTRRGNAVAAGAIAAFLRQQKWVPQIQPVN